MVHRPRVVTGYLRPKPKVYAYLRPKPKVYAYLRPMPAAPRVYDVAYPYGVGGDTLLDRVSVDFDSWVTSALIGYFFNRFVATPFGIPSVTGLLSQAVTAVTGREAPAGEDVLKLLTRLSVEMAQ